MKAPSGQELAKRIEAFSPYLTQVSRRDPALVQELFDQGGFQQRHSRSQLIRKFRKRLNGIDDFQTFALALRQIKQEEVLRIAARDLSGLAKFRETVQDLSALAEVSLQEALGFLQKDFTKTASRPAASEREGGLLILALGKFGGEELNFSSDIDLIFLYQPLRNREPSPLEQKEQFLNLARKIVQAMGSLIGGDQVFRVDLGLRPGGKDSELVISLDSALEYYQTEARTWERMALIKARPVAGNLLLGKTFLKEVLPVVYRKYVDYTVLADIRAMKEKILEEAGSHWMKGEDIKLGPGGIREVEFVAQSLQMVFGGRIPALQRRNTLKALEKLKEQGLLPNREFRELTQAYVFLRTLEHRIQMVHQRQTHSLPKEPSALASLAREMPLKWQRQAADAEGLRKKLAGVREKVRLAFDNLLLVSNQVSQERVQPFFEPSREALDWERGLQGLNFKNWLAAREILESWSKRTASANIRGKTFLTKLYPLILSQAVETPNPDQALSFADRFIRSVGGRTAILAMLLERVSLTKEVLTLFAQSAMLARLFVQNPEMIDHLVLQRSGGQFLEGEPLEPEPKGWRKKGDMEEALSRLRGWKSKHYLHTALEEIAGRMSSSETSERLTQLADRVLSESTRLAEETLKQEVVHPVYLEHAASTFSPFCILGLGKLGGRELGYASDLDLIFIYSLKTPYLGEAKKKPLLSQPKREKKWITYHEFLVRLAQRLISYLSLPLREGPGYTVDARLRPSGSFGPLIVSLDSFRDYYQSQAQNWEKQALLKARVVTGPPQLSRQISETIEAILYGTSPPAKVRNEMAHFRVRMEKERSGESEGKWNPKLGYGGLTDIEFIAQYLQWNHGQAHPELRQKNTLQVLKALKEAGLLSETNHLLLRQAYEFLTLLDHGLQLFYDRKGDARTYGRDELKELSRQNWLGLGSTLLPSWDLVSHCEKVRRNVRTIFESVFSDHNKKVPGTFL